MIAGAISISESDLETLFAPAAFHLKQGIAPASCHLQPDTRRNNLGPPVAVKARAAIHDYLGESSRSIYSCSVLEEIERKTGGRFDVSDCFAETHRSQNIVV